ncbi:MAG TPA: ribosome small subunit-dependent GTPase A [Terriglobales bacterium]|nr:ribosome small subunit-dependent GTPase A [Terriglobales bacterium]
MPAKDRAQLDTLGWDDWFAVRFAALSGTRPADGIVAARVVADHGTGRVVHTGADSLDAQLDRRLTAAARRSRDPLLPAVGDWVAITRSGRDAVIQAVLERRTAFRRKVAGAVSQEQVLAANVDVALVVAGLDAPPNLRRIERTLAMALSSGARPVVLLSKADIAGETSEERAAEVRRIAAGALVVAVSAMTGESVDRLPELVPPGRTGVLLGPSGVGKSTLVNRLAGGDVMRTAAVRSDGKGRHTTTHRQLVALPWGGLLIDTPGLRELQLWSDLEETGEIARLFTDVEELAARCRFADCGHSREPGCAVQAAISAGVLPPGRLESYRKLRRDATAVGQRVGRRRRHEAALGRRRRIALLREEDLAAGS